VNSLCIRAARYSDLELIASLHLQELPHDFASKLGKTFLAKHIYKTVLENAGILRVATHNSTIVGFIAISKTKGFRKQIFRPLLMFSIVRIFRVIPDLISIVGYSLRKHSQLPEFELLWIAVDKEHQNHGLGSALISNALSEVSIKESNGLWVKTLLKTHHNVEFYIYNGFRKHQIIGKRIHLIRYFYSQKIS
jgi:ribosomal protein S18 acetylase RimI-like enzyme